MAQPITSFAQNSVDRNALVVPIPKLAQATVLPVMLALIGKKIKKTKKDVLSQVEKHIFSIYPRNENTLNACNRMTKRSTGATNLIITTNNFSR